MVKKKVVLSSLLILFSLVSLSIFWKNSNVMAAENGVSLKVIKYGVDDKSGSQLNNLSGITYDVESVIPKNVDSRNSTKPENFKKDDRYSTTLLTDKDGFAMISTSTDPKFIEGYYLITERKSAAVKYPMNPVVIKLPLETDGKVNYNVTFYPKSNVVVPPETPNIPGKPRVPFNPPKKITQTSGEFYSSVPIYFLVIVIITMFGALVIYELKAKKKNHTQNS